MPIRVIAVVALFTMASPPASLADPMSALSFSLTYLDRFKIKDKEAGLTEPSGLALARNGDALWTISDDKKRIFMLDLEGRAFERSILQDRRRRLGRHCRRSGHGRPSRHQGRGIRDFEDRHDLQRDGLPPPTVRHGRFRKHPAVSFRAMSIMMGLRASPSIRIRDPSSF